MVRVALLFALTAAAEAARSNVEMIDAQIAEANFKIADANFDYEAADAADFDEELAAGNFEFEESEEQIGYTYGAPRQNHCFAGMASVSEFECLIAVQTLLAGQPQGRRNLVAGSWGWVPPGCSVQNGFTHGRNGDNAAHYNRNPNGRNDGGYTPVCAPQGFHAAGWNAPQPGFQPGFAGGAGNFLVADGCRRSMGNQNPEVRNAVAGFASVRCCSNNGRRCESTSIGCLQHQTYQQATAACAMRNMRLCSVQELDAGVCCGTGCGFDGHHIWTMTPAGGGVAGWVPGQSNGQHGFSGSGFNGGGFHNQVSNFKVVDGCLRSQGRQNARARSAVNGRASVRCCSFNGRRCETQTVGCLEGVSFNQAQAACTQRGMRLCSEQELNQGVCCGTGCGFDGRRVWSSTPAR